MDKTGHLNDPVRSDRVTQKTKRPVHMFHFYRSNY